ncbi:ChaB family protein [Wenzhouxiangella sp. EGI_FJ10409]|uniref:ChaB family protein n=1 Tax=Wenzhouxiangella sp. EGI_FJ10409 TaxID=3243767 RepID=UPI0035E39845
MPYDRNADLPSQVTETLPAAAQTIYRKAFNSAWAEYGDEPDREATAHRVAWSAVKASYEKNNDGDWVGKDD